MRTATHDESAITWQDLNQNWLAETTTVIDIYVTTRLRRRTTTKEQPVAECVADEQRILWWISSAELSSTGLASADCVGRLRPFRFMPSRLCVF